MSNETNQEKLEELEKKISDLELKNKQLNQKIKKESRLFSKFLNSFSSKNNFIVLFVRLFWVRKLSSTLQMTSTIAFPIPKIFILSFFGNNRFFSIWVASSAYFAT